MPRPELNARRKGASNAPKSSNPFINWLASRKERRKAAEEEASRLITNKIAENETIIIDKLNSIDFLHSKLPKSVLESKTNENQRYGDLEYAAKLVIHLLLKNPQTIKMDIRPIDQKLLTLVLMYKQSVEQGDVRAAYAAKGGLIRGINDIRNRIPQNQPELAKQFVEANTQYLDQWITLVGMAQVADRMKENVETQREQYNQANDRQKEETEALRKRINNDDDFAVAFGEIQAHDSPADRAKWTDVQREVHRMMVEERMKSVNLELNSLLLQRQEMDLSTKVAQVEILYSRVASLPIVADPNLMNKFQEQINTLFEELSRSDAELDETLKTMDDIEGRIKQLDSAPGAIRAREVAFEAAQDAAARIKKVQEDTTGKNAARARAMRESMGVLSDEKMEQMRKQAEEELKRAIQEAEEAAAQEAAQEAAEEAEETEGDANLN